MLTLYESSLYLVVFELGWGPLDKIIPLYLTIIKLHLLLCISVSGADFPSRVLDVIKYIWELAIILSMDLSHANQNSMDDVCSGRGMFNEIVIDVFPIPIYR